MVIIPQIFYVETDSFKKRSAQWSLRRVEPRIIQKNLSLNSSKTIVLLVRLGVKCRIVWQNEQKYPMYSSAHDFSCTSIHWYFDYHLWPHGPIVRPWLSGSLVLPPQEILNYVPIVLLTREDSEVKCGGENLPH